MNDDGARFAIDNADFHEAAVPARPREHREALVQLGDAERVAQA
jgi:hypothetical protein